MAPFSCRSGALTRLCASKRAVLVQRIGPFAPLRQAKGPAFGALQWPPGGSILCTKLHYKCRHCVGRPALDLAKSSENRCIEAPSGGPPGGRTPDTLIKSDDSGVPC